MAKNDVTTADNTINQAKALSPGPASVPPLPSTMSPTPPNATSEPIHPRRGILSPTMKYASNAVMAGADAMIKLAAPADTRISP